MTVAFDFVGFWHWRNWLTVLFGFAGLPSILQQPRVWECSSVRHTVVPWGWQGMLLVCDNYFQGMLWSVKKQSVAVVQVAECPLVMGRLLQDSLGRELALALPLRDICIVIVMSCCFRFSCVFACVCCVCVLLCIHVCMSVCCFSELLLAVYGVLWFLSVPGDSFPTSYRVLCKAHRSS